MNFPTRTEVSARLTDLTEGRLSPEEAAEWARPFVTDESLQPAHLDKPVWDAVTRLLGADLRRSPNEYLHGPDDFAAWLAEFRQSTGS